MTALAAYLAEAAGRKLEWGRFDCSLFVADWIVLRTGTDPVPDLRGRYGTERGALREIVRGGGLDTIFARRLAAIGLVRIAPGDAIAGDVGVVRAPARPDVLVGAIRTTAGWAAKTTEGLVVMPFVPLMSWGFVNG